MNNILNYIRWRGDLSFDMVPFNDADAAVMSEFSYLPLSGIIPEDFDRDISLGTACEKCAGRKMMSGHKSDKKLAGLLSKSQRFSGLKVSGFRQIIDDRQQFCAMSVSLGLQRHLIIFQGTDENLIGWKEDMQLSYMNEIPSQRTAVEYINDAGAAFPGEILTCGHSKGGNLAIYAPAFSNDDVLMRITRICSFDSPGFNEDVIKDKRLERIKDRITAYSPDSSLVGMLLEHNTELIPVKCKGGDGMTQHALFNWKMDLSSPLVVPEFSNIGNMNRRTMHLWVSELTYEQREAFVEALFSFISSKKNPDKQLSGKSFPAILLSYSKLNKKQRQALGLVLNNLGASFRDYLFNELKAWLSSLRETN